MSSDTVISTWFIVSSLLIMFPVLALIKWLLDAIDDRARKKNSIVYIRLKVKGKHGEPIEIYLSKDEGGNLSEETIDRILSEVEGHKNG